MQEAQTFGALGQLGVSEGMGQIRVAYQCKLFVEGFLHESRFHGFDSAQAPTRIDRLADKITLYLVRGPKAFHVRVQKLIVVGLALVGENDGASSKSVG